MKHPLVDLGHWKSIFSLESLRAEARAFAEERRQKEPSFYRDERQFEEHIHGMGPGGEIITSPMHLAVVEQIREEEFQRRGVRPSGVRTDVFVFSLTPPSRRDLTQIGGLPYWPASREWPVTDAGRPMTFLAQLSFLDSPEVRQGLPGDVLLVFTDPDSLLDPEGLKFFWMSEGESALVTSTPGADWVPFACYGHLCPTHDYPEAEEWFDDYHSPYMLANLEGTKIGGAPRWIQYDGELPGRFLGTVGSTHPATRSPYPWVDTAEPIGGWSGPSDALMWGDVGMLYLSWDGEKVHCTDQSY